jgi:hypothetical protein
MHPTAAAATTAYVGTVPSLRPPSIGFNVGEPSADILIGYLSSTGRGCRNSAIALL